MSTVTDDLRLRSGVAVSTLGLPDDVVVRPTDGALGVMVEGSIWPTSLTMSTSGR